MSGLKFNTGGDIPEFVINPKNAQEQAMARAWIKKNPQAYKKFLLSKGVTVKGEKEKLQQRDLKEAITNPNSLYYGNEQKARNEIISGQGIESTDSPVDWVVTGATAPARGFVKLAIETGAKNFAKSKIGKVIKEGVDLFDPTSLGFGSFSNTRKAKETIDALKKRIETDEGKKRIRELFYIDDPDEIRSIDYLSDEAKQKLIKQDEDYLNSIIEKIKNVGLKTNKDLVAAYNPLENEVYFNKDIKKRLTPLVIRHELEHGIQGSGVRYKTGFHRTTQPEPTLIDYDLENLTLLNPSSSSRFKRKTSKSNDTNDVVKNLSFYLGQLDDAIDYFKGKFNERSAMLAEIQEWAVQNKLIPNHYEKMTPEKMKQLYDYYMSKEKETPLRIFEIIDPSDKKNYEILSNNFNRLLSIPIIGAGISTIKNDNNNSKQSGLSFKKGGSIFDKERREGLRGWFSRNNNEGWKDCLTRGPCGGKKAGKKRLCRPTLADCPSKEKLESIKRKKVMGKSVSWK